MSQYNVGTAVERPSKNPLHTCERCGEDDVDVTSKYLKVGKGQARCRDAECGHVREF